MRMDLVTAAGSRRQFLEHWGGGLGSIALAHLLGRQSQAARPDWNGGLHHRAKAKRVVQLFMSGAASQCDMFDYKPLLIQRNGAKFDPGGEVELFQSSPGPVMQSPWEWSQPARRVRQVDEQPGTAPSGVRR